MTNTPGENNGVSVESTTQDTSLLTKIRTTPKAVGIPFIFSVGLNVAILLGQGGIHLGDKQKIERGNAAGSNPNVTQTAA